MPANSVTFDAGRRVVTVCRRRRVVRRCVVHRHVCYPDRVAPNVTVNVNAVVPLGDPSAAVTSVDRDLLALSSLVIVPTPRLSVISTARRVRHSPPNFALLRFT